MLKIILWKVIVKMASGKFRLRRNPIAGQKPKSAFKNGDFT